MRRSAVAVLWILTEPYQFLVGAMTSLQIAAPGVGTRASWAPNVFVAEAFTVLPLGFALLIWGGRLGRIGAVVCGLVMAGVDSVAAVSLSRGIAEGPVFFGLMALPWAALLTSAVRMGREGAAASG